MRRRWTSLALAAALAGPVGVAPGLSAPAVSPPAPPERAPSAPAPPERGAAPAAETNGDYRIGPEDLIKVTVWKNEALGAEVPVRPDGRISLPLLNDVPAAGLTPMELKETLTRRLAEYVPGAEVSVMVLEIRSPRVSVLGEVARPGRYDIRSRTTVLDLLALAGGLTEFAARSRILVLRRAGERVERMHFDYDRAMKEGSDGNFDLRPGDIVLVR